MIEAIEVPTETVTEARALAKKVAVERKFMPGYVLAKLEMTDQVYHLVKNTPKVTAPARGIGAANPARTALDRPAGRGTRTRPTTRLCRVVL